MRPADPHAEFCRLTVLAPRARVDVSLPADVPVAELVPMVLELVGEPVFGLRPEPWRLSGAGGGPLPPAATLAELGVPDGELLRLAPAAPPPPPPVFDDPVDALAATAGGAENHRFTAGAVLATAIAAATLLAAGPGGAVAAAVAGTAAAGAIVATARLARRVGGPGAARVRLAACTAGLIAVPLAGAAGWAGLAEASGAARLLLTAAAAGTAAAAAQIALRVVAPPLIAAVVAAVPVGLAALVVLRFDVPVTAVASGACAVALAAGPLLPRAALRLAGMPRPAVPADAAELAEAEYGPDALPPGELAERADLARGYLAGLTGGCAVVAAVAALPAAAGGGWAGLTLAGVATAVLALRARSYADPAPTRTLLACAAATTIGLAWLSALRTGQPVAAGALIAVAIAGIWTLAGGGLTVSPVLRRTVDLLEGVLIAASIPLALAAMDLFRAVRRL